MQETRLITKGKVHYNHVYVIEIILTINLISRVPLQARCMLE